MMVGEIELESKPKKNAPSGLNFSDKNQHNKQGQFIINNNDLIYPQFDNEFNSGATSPKINQN